MLLHPHAINKLAHHGNGVTILNPHQVQVNVAPPNHILINVPNHAKIIVGPTMIILVIKLVELMIVGVTKLPLKRNQPKMAHLPPNNQEVILVILNNHLNPKRRV
jgi:hypothetical protein